MPIDSKAGTSPTTRTGTRATGPEPAPTDPTMSVPGPPWTRLLLPALARLEQLAETAEQVAAEARALCREIREAAGGPTPGHGEPEPADSAAATGTTAPTEGTHPADGADRGLLRHAPIPLARRDRRSTDHRPEPPTPPPPATLRLPARPPQDPLPLCGCTGPEVATLLDGLGDGQARLVDLRPPASAEVLRDALPDGLTVQPDGDGVHATHALLYRCREAAPAGPGIRTGYRLVDLLAMLAPSHQLDESLYADLRTRLPGSAVPESMHEHVLARAQWRCWVPATADEVRPQLEDLDETTRSTLCEMLYEVARDHPEHAEGLVRTLRVWDLGVPTEFRPCGETAGPRG